MPAVDIRFLVGEEIKWCLENVKIGSKVLEMEIPFFKVSALPPPPEDHLCWIQWHSPAGESRLSQPSFIPAKSLWPSLNPTISLSGHLSFRPSVPVLRAKGENLILSSFPVSSIPGNDFPVRSNRRQKTFTAGEFSSKLFRRRLFPTLRSAWRRSPIFPKSPEPENHPRAPCGVGQAHISRLAETLECKASGWPILYLGLPLGGNPRVGGFWDPVIERISRRLDGWQKAYLSFGGRITLIQSCLTHMPCYFLSLFKLPASVAAKIERLQRDFLWSGIGEGKKDHLVRWDVVCKPKEIGGLGFGNISLRNLALLGKWLWRYPREGSALWHQVILSIYGSHSNGWDANTIVRWSTSLSLESYFSSLSGVFLIYSICGRKWGKNSFLGRFVVGGPTFGIPISKSI
ncbi:putative ribonuclease H protein [Vitis vinifera]|uniref:Putative ribonuclease H protein n=1 Tax=Vitis vinifera TaxID=29760 RepID=A0A438D8S4_VITVI|nr:putative ribonuclease H protein [Vitis vinifera]